MIRDFVSFPKSGRTWLRYILTSLDLEKSVRFHHDRFEFNDGTCPSHCFDLNLRMKNYSSVDRLVYLERDPRDIMVSLYFQITGRFSDFFSYKGTISEFIRDDYFGAQNLQRFRLMWSELTEHYKFLKISYEDCHKNTFDVATKVLCYYEFNIETGKVIEAVKGASFEKMRDIEHQEIFPHPWLRPRNGSLKVRRGIANGYVDALSGEDIEYLNSIFY